MRELIITVAGMHCASCGLLIDDTLLDIDGVTSSKTDVKSGTCVVTVTEVVSDGDVLAAIASSGYEGTLA